MAYENILLALSDSTRRAVFERLRSGPISVGEIAAELPVSRPAVSQHLKVLKDAGLVRHEAQGTRRVYEIEANGLAELRSWLDGFWDTQLQAFKQEAEKPARAESASRKPRRTANDSATPSPRGKKGSKR